jgi:sporulation related protein
MGILLRTLACLGILLASVAPLAAFEGPTTAAANNAPAAPANAEEESSVNPSQRMIEAGVKAYDTGKMDQAIRAFTKALKGGGLNNAQTARALYYRGLAYRRQEKPAQAISDLSRAAWMKNGLDATEQQNALSNRVGAYRDAGIASVPSLTPAPAAFDSDLGGWSTAMNGEVLAPPVAPVTSIAPAPPPATLSGAPTSSPPASSSSSGGVSGFFSSITNMFGGSSSSSNDSPPPPPPDATPVTSTASLAGNDTVEPSAGWTTTEVGSSPLPPVTPPPAPAASASPAFDTKVAKAPPPPAAAPPASAGKYHVQVAAVRTREEAYALSVRLMSQHASELGGRRPSVEETVIGSMGTFYRVRLGPFASANEPENLCGSIRSSGFDCLVVTQ